MTRFADLVAELSVAGPLNRHAGAEPLGAAWLADDRHGVDLAAHGYREDEYLVSGRAETWTWDGDLCRVATGPQRFTTRILVRRPADPAAFSGAVQLEPHHPESDRALSWAALAPWIVRSGHAHVGVTQEPMTVPDLVAFDAERYAKLAITDPTHRWDIVGLVAGALRRRAIPSVTELDVRRIVMSGWSMTGTFCRTFLGERFHERASLDGRAVIDGYVICISSGNAQRAGYASFRSDARLAPDDPRRTIQPHGVPVVELLSEAEAETHGPVLRKDGDAPEDRYRLYEVAGTGHIIGRDRSLSTNTRQRALRGLHAAPCEIAEAASDARMDLAARATFEAVDRWIADGGTPPASRRFAFAPDGPRGMMEEACALARDEDGNVLGGVRTPWVEVPLAGYLPHSTPAPGNCDPFEHLAGADPRHRADLTAHMRPFDRAKRIARYGNRAHYLERFEAAARELAAEGWLLEDDLPELLTDRRARCDPH